MCANNNGICASKAGNVVGTGTSEISVCVSVCTIQVRSGVCAREGCVDCPLESAPSDQGQSLGLYINIINSILSQPHRKDKAP